MNLYVTARDFFSTLKETERVFLLVRHGERRHITPEDSDGGAHVGLTDKGREQAFNLGTLFPAEGDAVYFSSPVGRCFETAQRIGLGRESVGGPVPAPVEILDPLGDFFVRNFDEYLAVLNEKFYPSICDWIRDGDHPAYYNLHDRAEEMRSMMLEKGNARFNVFASHDAWIVPCLAHFCKFSFTPGIWMNFLSGIAFVEDVSLPVGNHRRERIVAVTGLEDGNLYF